MAELIPAFVEELSEAESVAALASMPKRAADALDQLLKSSGEKRSTDGKRPRYRITGIASTEHRDRQGDVIKQAGLDWRQFLASGFINDDHGKDAGAVIGYPTAVRKLTLRGDSNEPVAATAIEGYLFDVPRAETLVKLAKSMEGTPRQMGFSVEGPPPKRSMTDPNLIESAAVTHVALTPWPVNQHAVAWVELAKSFRKAMTAGDGIAAPDADVPGDVAPLIVQDLFGAGRPVKRATAAIKAMSALIRRRKGGATNNPAGQEAAEGAMRMNARDFLKGKKMPHDKLSDDEAMAFAKAMGYAPKDDDEADEFEKSARELTDLLKSMSGETVSAPAAADFSKTAALAGGLAKSGNADGALIKSLVGEIKTTFGEQGDVLTALHNKIVDMEQAVLLAGQLNVDLAKSLNQSNERLSALENGIAVAMGKPGAPRAAVSARPVPRFPDDSAPGDGMVKSNTPLGQPSREQLLDGLGKSLRDAHVKGDRAAVEVIQTATTKLGMNAPVDTYTDAEKAAIARVINKKD